MARWNFRAIEDVTGYEGPATYKVRLIRENAVASIARFLGCDERGIVQIGQTSNFESRRRQFVSGLRTGRGHSAANLIHYFEQHRGSRRRLNRCEFEIAYLPQQTVEQAKLLEEKLIKSYLLRFGEVPPLASAIPRRYGQR